MANNGVRGAQMSAITTMTKWVDDFYSLKEGKVYGM